MINVPARGIGKGVMESLEAVELADGRPTLPPLLAGLQPAATNNSLWAQAACTPSTGGCSRRARSASLTAFRDLLAGLTAMAAQETVSIALGKVLDQSGYLQDLREERSEEAEGRIENLVELVSAAREYETRHPEPTLGGFVDQLSLLSDVDEEAGSRDARVLMMTMHSAKGLEFPGRRDRRARGRTLPAFAVERGRGRARRGAAPVLRRASRARSGGWC